MKLYITSFLLLVSAACTSTHTSPPIENRPPVLQQVESGKVIYRSNQHTIRYPESIKAYSLGRRVDIFDPSLMYEGGVVYRIVNDSSWNLQPGLPEHIPFGDTPPVQVKENENALRAEIEVKANEQRTMYRFLKDASDKASRQISALEASHQISRKLLEQNRHLKESLSKSRTENKQLQNEVELMKDKLQSLLRYYQQKEVENAKSKFRRTP